MAFLNSGLLSVVSSVNQMAYWLSFENRTPCLCEYLSFVILLGCKNNNLQKNNLFFIAFITSVGDTTT